MSIILFDPAMNLDHLKGEKSVMVWNGEDESSVEIHPWSRDHRDMGVGYGVSNQVAITVGYMREDATKIPGEHSDDDGYEIAIVEKEDFIEAILAVFPELKRAE